MARIGIGSRWEPELNVYQDPVSGATVHQLTNYKGHSNHFYFTYPCWYDEGRKIVFCSDRRCSRSGGIMSFRASYSGRR